MKEKRIIAYFMHEHEQVFAQKNLSQYTSTESFVIGEISEDKIKILEEAGLIVQELLDEVPPEPLDELISATRELAAPAAGIDRNEIPDVVTDRYIAQLAGPLIEPWREDLNKAGASVLEAVGSYRVILRVPDASYSDVSKLSIVQRLVKYSSLATDAELIPKSRSVKKSVQDEMRRYDIGVHEGQDLTAIVDWLIKHNVTIAGQSARKVRVYFLGEDPRLNELAALPEVSLISEYKDPVLYNDRARVLMGLDDDTTGAHNLALTGAGQTIGIADSGLDDSHPDFQGRIVGLVALGRPGDSSDTHGHGTHVTGSALGNGSASGGSICGAAPQANVFFQSILDGNGRLGGLPLDLNDLFQEAYDNGARIHNNSWGADVEAAYTFNSIEADEFVHNNLDMTIVVAAGNDGSAGSNENASTGFVDWLSIGAPATSKNALTVGASRSDRTSGGLSNLTFGAVWPGDFPDAPIRDENTSGDPESMAAFSSRGPCDDRRIKPDLVAPGTNIASAKSMRAPLRNFWGAFPGHSGRYAYMGGTSMAAPLVSGCAALVREFYEAQNNHQPSAALVKATLINGTRWLSGDDSIAEFASAPNFHQGFGCVDMLNTLPNDELPNLSIAFHDDWQINGSSFDRTGQRMRFEIDVDDSLPLRICLTWTDIPGRALQNNLNLFVQEMPNGQKFMGNADLPLRLRLPDAENNVEVVRIDSPASGSYLIQVSAGNLLAAGQKFALIASGAGLNGFRQV